MNIGFTEPLGFVCNSLFGDGYDGWAAGIGVANHQ
jgi:hypothetical protein